MLYLPSSFSHYHNSVQFDGLLTVCWTYSGLYTKTFLQLPLLVYVGNSTLLTHCWLALSLIYGEEFSLNKCTVSPRCFEVHRLSMYFIFATDNILLLFCGLSLTKYCISFVDVHQMCNNTITLQQQELLVYVFSNEGRQGNVYRGQWLVVFFEEVLDKYLLPPYLVSWKVPLKCWD